MLLHCTEIEFGHKGIVLITTIYICWFLLVDSMLNASVMILHYYYFLQLLVWIHAHKPLVNLYSVFNLGWGYSEIPLYKLM